MLSEPLSFELLQEPLENHMGYQLRRAAVLVQADLTAVLKELNLIPSAAFILLVLSNKKDLIQMELSNLLGIQRTNISPLIARLEKRGFLSRSSLDGRSHYLKLTGQGIKEIPRILDCLEQHAKNCFAHLSASKMSKLNKALKNTQHLIDQKVSNSEDVAVYRQLSFLIVRTSSFAMSKLVKELAPLGLTPSNASAMVMIANNSGIHQSKLGRSLDIKRANISTLISELKVQKLVNVQVKGRTQELSLSKKGQALVKRIAQILNQHETYFFNHIKKPQELISSLSAIRQQLTKK
ncbi:MAG: MarR family transcriptional regulator [Gammaproteobacteria bacterium]|nr:MarR family transcriptional regulator [Gammaproteobacteria bacterium]